MAVLLSAVQPEVQRNAGRIVNGTHGTDWTEDLQTSFTCAHVKEVSIWSVQCVPSVPRAKPLPPPSRVDAEPDDVVFDHWGRRQRGGQTKLRWNAAGLPYNSSGPRDRASAFVQSGCRQASWDVIHCWDYPVVLGWKAHGKLPRFNAKMDNLSMVTCRLSKAAADSVVVANVAARRTSS